MVKILLKFKGEILETYQIEKEEISIGRSADSDIVIDNLGVSNNHARILKTGEGYSIEDLKSTNGTLLNNKGIAIEPLKDEDIITIGKHDLEVYIIKKGAQGKGDQHADPTYVMKK
jgi:pSer/pThr/pTyr-binding forkhead associated (FHA) protein